MRGGVTSGQTNVQMAVELDVSVHAVRTARTFALVLDAGPGDAM